MNLMKTYLLLFLTMAGLTPAACSQRLTAKDPPALIQNTLKARFPNATEVEWEKKKDLFEAAFFQGPQEHSVLLDATGTIRMIKQDIAATELPAAIAEVLKKNYAAYTLDDSERIEKGGEVFYQVELEKGMREQHLVFAANGGKTSQLPYWD
jgi:hypothetical protein